MASFSLLKTVVFLGLYICVSAAPLKEKNVTHDAVATRSNMLEAMSSLSSIQDDLNALRHLKDFYSLSQPREAESFIRSLRKEKNQVYVARQIGSFGQSRELAQMLQQLVQQSIQQAQFLSQQTQAVKAQLALIEQLEARTNQVTANVASSAQAIGRIP